MPEKLNMFNGASRCWQYFCWEALFFQLKFVVCPNLRYALIPYLTFFPDLRAQESAYQAMYELMMFGPDCTPTKVVKFLERSSLDLAPSIARASAALPRARRWTKLLSIRNFITCPLVNQILDKIELNWCILTTLFRTSHHTSSVQCRAIAP